MSKFKPLQHYEEALSAGYRLLPFRFTQLEGDRYVASNIAGEFVVIDRSKLDEFAKLELAPNDPLYSELKSKHFLLGEAANQTSASGELHGFTPFCDDAPL
jgi:hypothetical protein